MKLKYKKIILITTMGAMGIGMLTLSITKDKLFDKPTSKEVVEAENGAEITSMSENLLGTETDLDLTQIPSSTDEITPELTPEPIVLPVYELERDAYPEINDLFKKYYAAKLASDMDMMTKLVSDVSYLGSVEDIQKKTEYIEDYRNIECYTKKTYEEGSYIVYVNYEVKFVNIDTLAPGIDKFFVKIDEDGKACIYFGEVDDQLYDYFVERQQDEDVVALYDAVDEKGEEAKKKDEALMNFWKLLDEYADDSSEDAKTEEDAKDKSTDKSDDKSEEKSDSSDEKEKEDKKKD